MKNELLSFTMSSERRKDIIYLLLDGPITLRELTNHFGIKASGLIPRIRELECKNLVVKDDGKYRLSNKGIILVKKLQMMYNLTKLLEENERFLNEHDLVSIPINLLCRIDEIGNYKQIISGVDNMHAPRHEIFDNLSRSKFIACISPIFDIDYPEFFLSIARQNVQVSIITTEAILEKIEKDHADALQQYLKCDNARMYAISDARLAFAVTDAFISISLYKNGILDTSTNLMGFETSAIKWGMELFEYYKQRSREINEIT